MGRVGGSEIFRRPHLGALPLPPLLGRMVCDLVDMAITAAKEDAASGAVGEGGKCEGQLEVHWSAIISRASGQ